MCDFCLIPPLEVVSLYPLASNIFNVTDPWIFAEESIWKRFPLEMWIRVIRFLDLQALFAFGEIGKWFHRLVHDEYRRFMERAFQSVKLNWHSLRFMLVHTESLLSGWAAHHMLFPGSGQYMFDGLEQIDIFIDKRREDQVLAYFARATAWKPATNTTLAHPFIFATTTLTNADVPATKIAVHISYKENPRCTVFRFPLSTQFVHFDGHSVVVPYSNLSMRGLAIPNKLYLPIDGNDDVRALVSLEKSANKHKVHLCMLGTDQRIFSRYYAVLSTLDDLSETFILRDRVWGLYETPKVPRYATIWCLGPQVEPLGTALKFFVQCQPLISDWTDKDTQWSICYDVNLCAGADLD
ncbi:hypothetical protein GGX14DRAFT_397843 [Mycena pura]|uniref:F-box domain-containing protein n=1 Tax=Mycena pura TaxID=153505 RepID=A0AAD6V7Q0_9AGAR|nr:hypothetical protein GGX14DRAFT_397843 [Mycena pura]